jgi:hypothetical protein
MRIMFLEPAVQCAQAVISTQCNHHDTVRIGGVNGFLSSARLIEASHFMLKKLEHVRDRCPPLKISI